MENKYVKDLNSPEYQFVSDSQDVAVIEDLLPEDSRRFYDSFLVKLNDGDYAEIWGISGIVPYLDKIATRIR